MENENYRISYKFLRKLMLDKSIQEILDFCSDYLHNPLLLFGYANNIIAFSSDAEIDGNIPAALSFHANPQERAQWQESLTDEFKEIRLSEVPVISEDGFCFSGKRRMTMRMQYDKAYLGAIVLIEINRPFCAEDGEYLQIVNRLIAEKLFMSRGTENNPAFAAQQNLIALINGQRDADPEKIRRTLGKNLQSYVIAALDIHRLSAPDIDRMTLYISRLLLHSVPVLIDREMILLAGLASPQSYFQTKSVLADTADRFQICCGLSMEFEDINEIQTCCRQARDVKNCMQNEGCTSGLFDFSILTCEVLLYHIKEEIDLSAYICAPVRRLQAYDRANNTDYLHTLFVYLRNGKNRAQTCRQLHIHKNTLAYRLEKISEYTNGSFDDGSFLFSVMLTDCILRCR